MWVFVGQASGGCGRWVVRDNTDYLADPAFDLAGGPLSETATSESNFGDASKDSANKLAAEAIVVDEAPMDLSGRWSMELNDTSASHLSLIIFETGSRVQGYGNLTRDGAELPVTAMGLLTSDTLKLDVKLIVNDYLNQIERKYEMLLDVTEGTMTGNYSVYESGEMVGTGNVTGNRFAP